MSRSSMRFWVFLATSALAGGALVRSTGRTLLAGSQTASRTTSPPAAAGKTDGGNDAIASEAGGKRHRPPTTLHAKADQQGQGQSQARAGVHPQVRCRVAENPDRTQYMVTRQKATEPAFSGKYASGHFRGTFLCVCCDAEALQRRRTSSIREPGGPASIGPQAQGGRASDGLQRSRAAGRGHVPPLRRPSWTCFRRWSADHRPAILHQFGGHQAHASRRRIEPSKAASRYDVADQLEGADEGEAESQVESQGEGRDSRRATPRNQPVPHAGDRPAGETAARPPSRPANRPAERSVKIDSIASRRLLTLDRRARWSTRSLRASTTRCAVC